jgi:LytTR family transcriptional regulator, CO-responsive transcriptional regulator RcoM
MDTKNHQESPLYIFEKFDVGIVQLDADRQVVGMNDFARKVLPVDQMKPFDRFILDFHPERSRPKVNFLIDQASICPVANNVPMTMIINIPEQVLLIKVSRTTNQQGQLNGFVLVFYDVTQIVAQENASLEDATRRLQRIPVSSKDRVTFLEVESVCCIESEGHYTRLLSPEGWHFCNLSIGDLEARLNKDTFVRVHRRYIVNLMSIDILAKDGTKTVLQFKKHPKLSVPVSRTVASELKKRLKQG